MENAVNNLIKQGQESPQDVDVEPAPALDRSEIVNDEGFQEDFPV